MKIPKLKLQKFPITEKRKSNNIIYKLTNMGYEVDNAKEALAIFEKHDIDKSQFDFPYGSFESYKQHVLADDLEPDLTSHIITKEQHEQNIKDVQEGKLWEMY